MPKKRLHCLPKQLSAPLPNNPRQQGRYTPCERDQYDDLGNITSIAHVAANAMWTRRYAYEVGTNRLSSTSMPGDPVGGPYTATYSYDAFGNAVAMLSIYQFSRHPQSFGSGRHLRRSFMAQRRPRVNQESLPRASLAG